MFELIAQGAGLETVLGRIVDVAVDDFGSAPVSIELIDSRDGRLRTVASSNLPAAYAGSISMIAGAGAGTADRRRKDDAGDTRDAVDANGIAAKIRQASLNLEMPDCLPWPIWTTKGELAGFLTIHGKPGRGQGRRSRIESLARLTRIAIESARQVQFADHRFATLAATIPGVVYQRLVTPDGDIRYIYISEGCADLFGLEPSEILADPNLLFDCFGPEYRATFKDRLLAASKSLTLWDVEAQIVTPDGAEKLTHAIAKPQRQPDGAVLWTGVILDATRIKVAELGLRRAKEAAENANSAKTQFLASMSHELRTPLNAIIGFSEILKSEAFGPLGSSDYVQYAHHVHNSAHGLLETINSIFEFTRFETFDVEINDRSIHIADVIQAAVARACDLAHNANIRIVGPPGRELPILICDEDLVRRMLVHLLSNGVKFTPEDGRVEIGAEYLPTGALAVRVSDNGIGIAEEDMPKIFEAFGQIDGALSRHYGGNGLGVPLAVSMAKLHGAELNVESELGLGTTVSVVFPKERVIGRARRRAAR